MLIKLRKNVIVIQTVHCLSSKASLQPSIAKTYLIHAGMPRGRNMHHLPRLVHHATRLAPQKAPYARIRPTADNAPAHTVIIAVHETTSFASLAPLTALNAPFLLVEEDPCAALVLRGLRVKMVKKVLAVLSNYCNHTITQLQFYIGYFLSCVIHLTVSILHNKL